jgi:hypothetical protein
MIDALNSPVVPGHCAATSLGINDVTGRPQI